MLQVENLPLGGRILTIEIFEVPDTAPTKASGTLLSPVRSAPSTPLASSNSARANGFRVAARDDVENEYSLFVTRQKAEYLYRAAYPAEAEESEEISPEAMANGILTYLNIIGNRQRDVGKLVCREPEPHVKKKARVLPTSTPPNKQRNPHLPSKRQDQRAVRVQKTSERTMEAVASAMRLLGSGLNGDDDSEMDVGKFDRKGSEASILHRMAVADSKTMWKAQLETNYEESDHPSFYELDASAAAQEYTLAPGLSPLKRALPERRTKHKDLEERRQKGRQQRIMVAQAAHDAPNSVLNSIQGQGSYRLLVEENDPDSDPLSPVTTRRTSMVTVDSTDKPTAQPRAASAPRSSVGTVYSLRNLFELSLSEPEQFLRRRTLDTHRSVLGNDRWQDDILGGMEIEITDERPSLETPPNKLDALLNTARRVMVVNTVGGSSQRNTGPLKLAPGRRRGRTSTSPNLYVASLNTSHSAPRLRVSTLKDEPVKPESLEVGGLELKYTSQKQPDDPLIHHEDRPPPQVVGPSISEETCVGLQSRSRSRSNSVGCEGVLRLAPLPSTTPKAPAQKFLALPEPEKASSARDVVQEKEISVVSPDPEVVLYSRESNELILEEGKNDEEPAGESMDKLSQADSTLCQGVVDDTENADLPPAGVNSVFDDEAQVDTSGLDRLAFSLNSQSEVFPSTSRQECWDDPSELVLYPELYGDVGEISTVAVEVNAAESDKLEDQQQRPAEEDVLEGLIDTTKFAEEKEDVEETEFCELAEQVEDIISNNQIRSCANSPRVDEDDGEPAKDHLLCANNDDYLSHDDAEQYGENVMPGMSTEALDSIDRTGDSVVIQNELNTLDNGGEVVDTPVKSSRSGDNIKAIDLSADCNDDDSATMLTFATLTEELSHTALFDSDQNHYGSNVASNRASVPDENNTQPSDEILPSEEGASVLLDAAEDMAPMEQNYDHDETVIRDQLEPRLTTPPQKPTENGAEQFSTPELRLFDDNSLVRTPSILREESTLEASPDREKPVEFPRKKSVNPRKKSSLTTTGQVKTSKVLGSKRRSLEVQIAETQVMVQQLPSKLERRHTAEDVNNSDQPRSVRRTSTINPKSQLPGLHSSNTAKTTSKASAETSAGAISCSSTKRQTISKPQPSGAAHSVTTYHKKWGTWMAGKHIIEKVGCLQYEELVMADPQNEENLLKLGYRYARSPDTSMPAILLLENAALLHKHATGTREYWFWLGSAHLDIFMRQRKYLPAARFHLDKSFRAFTSAFAYLESLVDPMLLLRYAIVLFWHKGDGNLKKTRDIFHELFSQFVIFCDRDRPNLLFLQFQVLHRLKLYVDAIDCMNRIITLHEKTKSRTGVILPSPVYDTADYGLMLMQCQQASGDYVSAAQSLVSVLKDKNEQQATTLKDEEYFDLWHALAEKCLHHEDYALALEYYAIALNFAKQSQALAAIHYKLGLCFQSLGEDGKCVTEYKRARTANRHVPPLVTLTELNVSYEVRYAQLLQRSVVQTVEEVRVEVYGKAARRLQRVFRRSRRNLNAKPDIETPVTKMPSLSKRKQSTIAPRKASVVAKVEEASNKTEVKKEESLPQKAVALDDNQANRHEENVIESVEHRHESFLARKQAAMEEMAELLTSPQYRGREASPSSRSNARLKATSQLRSGLLSPEKDRLDARRKESMDTFHQLGYVSSTMPWIEFWEKLLALAPELFNSRHALYGNIARIRGRQPLVTDEVAFCALAESIGNVHEAAEKLHDASYERELTYVCAVIEVSKLLERYFPLDPMQLSLKPPHVSLPTISSPTADSIAAHSSHTPSGIDTTRCVMLPPTRVASPSTSKPKKHLRMNEMLDLHFQEHVQKQEAALAITDATRGFVHPPEKLMVLRDFRQANSVLVSSQLAFGSGKATI